MIKPFPFAILRAPLQPLDNVYNFGYYKNSLFDAGVYLASREFWKEYQKIELCSAKERRKLEISFNKYWIRSSMRCTPFATFAGSMIVRANSDVTSLIVDLADKHLLKSRIDMNYLSAISSDLTQIPGIQRQMLLYPNNSLYEFNNAYRYVEYKFVNFQRKYQLSSVQKDDYIAQVLSAAKEGRSIHQLAQILIVAAGVEEDEACNFVVRMWKSQVLVSSFDLCITGKEPIYQLHDQLKHIDNVGDLTTQIRLVENLLERRNSTPAQFSEAEKEIIKLSQSVEIPKDLIQTDMFISSASNVINRQIINRITENVSDLQWLARKNENKELENFKSKFIKKYDNTEVALALALDADTGIGYAGIDDSSTGDNQLIYDLMIKSFQDKKGLGGSDYIKAFVFQKYMLFLQGKDTCIEITEAELKQFENNVDVSSFPSSMFIIGNLLCKENSIVDEDNCLFRLASFGGRSAGNLLARFTHGSEELFELTNEILREEEKQDPEVIYAEIVHLPQARIGNVLLRPLLRKYEIPYVGRSGADIENQIGIEDLYISIVNGQIILRSKILNRRVMPRLTTAHNFNYNSLPVYKFLCDLQFQNVLLPNVWDWGEINNNKYLPRVMYKNLIIKRARWRVVESDIEAIPFIDVDLLKWAILFLEKSKIPSKVVYVEGDNELLIDFDYKEGVDIFLYYLRKNKKIDVEEFLFSKENCVVKNVRGESFCNELIIPVYKEIKPNNIVGTVSEAPSVKRTFFPGEHWHYFKIYMGPQSADRLLAEVFLPFIEKGLTQSMFRRFFFLRYKDDFSHIRIRFCSKDCGREGLLQKKLFEELQEQIALGVIDKVVIDTYTRELDRYGAEIIEEVEELFFNDSVCVMQLLGLLYQVEDRQKYRFLFALRGIDVLLNDFKLPLSAKHALLKQAYFLFYNEFGGQKKLQEQLNDKYRVWQKEIKSHMNVSNDPTNGIEEAIEFFNNRSLSNMKVIESILEKYTDEERGNKVMMLLPNLIHMFLNRIFLSQQRKWELIIYHFLERYYNSAMAMENNRKIKDA